MFNVETQMGNRNFLKFKISDDLEKQILAFVSKRYGNLLQYGKVSLLELNEKVYTSEEEVINLIQIIKHELLTDNEP